MIVPHQTDRARMPGTTVPSETNGVHRQCFGMVCPCHVARPCQVRQTGCTDSVLARSAHATWHDRAKELFVARSARATAVSAAAALRV